MFGKEGVSMVHASDQTRPMQSITQCSVFDVPPSRKRKRVSNFGESLEGSILVRPHPGSAPSPPQSLKPILILPRSHLPLSYLDTVVSSTAFSASRLFTAHIRALEPESSNGEGPVILIIRNEADRSLYAVEWVSKGIYAMCKLGGWVKEETLVGAALSAKEEPQVAIVNLDAGGNDSAWWRSARTNLPPLPTFEARSERVGDNGAAGFHFSMKRKPKAPLGTPGLPDSELCSRGDQSTVNMIMQSPEPMEGTAATGQSAQEIFDMVRTQYLETLYISRASLAYFPKGPLSRLRAGFSAGQNNPVSQTDLITFLRSLVLSLSLIDKKYKNSVPEFVASLPALNFSGDDADAIAVKGRKKRRSKMKPGKGGLYPGEDDYLRKWWVDGDSDPRVTPGEMESNVEQVKRRVATLRTRETELQIILILEIFALRGSSHLRGQHGEWAKPSIGASLGSEGKNRKWNSSKDLALVLDLLVDRLCIWQSVSSGGDDTLCMDNFGNPKAPGQSDRNTANTKAMGVGQSNDHLRDFCNEVIMPFYAARLPEYCNIVSRKLGGLTGSPSLRPPLAKITGSAKASSRPGDAIKRTAPLRPRPRQTLERALTAEKKARSVSRGPPMPSMIRSATSPAVSGLKRETSECLLWSVPPKDSKPPMNVFRGGVLKSKRFSQREIDMSFTANTSNAKLQRKVKIEEELKEAIAALKKPNRGLAIKEFVETSERRALGGASSSKGTKKPIRNSLDVQVLATPKGNRKINVGVTPPVYQNRSRLLEGPKSVPSPNEQYATRPATQTHLGEQISVSQSIAPSGHQPLRPSVQDTPSRVRPMVGDADTQPTIRTTVSFPVTPSYKRLASKTSQLGPKDLDRSWGNELENPIEAIAENQGGQRMGFRSNVWAASVQGTPLESVESNARARIDVGIKETPIKETRKAGVGEALSTGRGTSIYEALGWDEADDFV